MEAAAGWLHRSINLAEYGNNTSLNERQQGESRLILMHLLLSHY